MEKGGKEEAQIPFFFFLTSEEAQIPNPLPASDEAFCTESASGEYQIQYPISVEEAFEFPL